jgi:hypothetical protein
MERLFSDEELAYLPIGFQFFVKSGETPRPTPEFQEKVKFIKINYYNTDKYKLYGHYKPLSKIIKITHDIG